MKDVRGAVASRAQDAAEGVADVAKKGRTALLAGGAAAAGVAATLFVAQRQRQRPKVLGVKLPARNGLDPRALLPKRRPDLKRDVQNLATKVSDAADRADQIGQRVSSVASSVKQVSETTNKAAKKA